MKNFILSLFVGLLFLTSCSNKKEKVVVEFLNNTEAKFDKNKFELVKLNLLDTIHEIDIYKYSDFSSYPSLVKYESSVDSAAIDTTSLEGYVQNEVYWESEPYSKGLYDFIRYDGDNSGYFIGNQNTPNKFLNSIVRVDYESFRQNLLNNIKFQNKLKDEISSYEYFKGVFSSDSLLKFVYMENVKSKKIYGFLYELTFRSNSILQKRKVIFDDKQEKIIAYKEE